jgi:hypothetical protein
MPDKKDVEAARRILSDIALDPRSYPAKGRESITTMGKIAISLPAWMIEKLDELGEARSHHIQRALKLYFKLFSKK